MRPPSRPKLQPATPVAHRAVVALRASAAPVTRFALTLAATALAAALAAGLAACAAPPASEAVARALALEPSRITDTTIARDRKLIADLQERHDKLGRADPARAAGPAYALAKAGCWIDAGRYQYARNDRTAFPEGALDQASRLLFALEHNTSISTETPLVNQAARLREDLWQRAAELKAHAGLRCAAAALACGEVALVQAGDQFSKFGWQQARGHVARAEELLDRAGIEAQRCVAPPAAAAPAVAEPRITRVEKMILEADALFHFDHSAPEHLRAEKKAELDALAAQIVAMKSVEQVRVLGYTDELGGVEYNRRLSLARAETIRAYLVARGVAAAAIRTEGRGEADPIASCENVASRAARVACLAPNRRVEIEVSGVLK